MAATREALQHRHGAPRFIKVFSSPLRRSIEGARLIAGHDVPILTIDEFVEVDFGLFEGLTHEEIRVRYPEEFERWDKDRLAPDYAYAAGESRRAFADRVAIGVDRMLQSWQADPDARGGCALLVAHRGVIRAITRLLVGAEPDIDLGSIHILSHDHGWRARTLDATDHLADLATPG
jgi:alpha-ribazole phosphatase